MELRQLRYLIAVAEEGSFTRGAERVNIAQPALSRQIQKLEAELGMALVDRTTRRASLTPAGRQVVTAGRRVLAELAALGDLLQEEMALLRGTVRLGVTQTTGPFDVPAALAAFNRRHPDVELIVREALSVDLAAQLREDKLELAVVSDLSQAERDQLDLESARVEPLTLVLPAEHPLAERESLSIAELSGERFISFPPGATIRASIERRAVEVGFVPRGGIETSDVARMLALVAHGLGVAVLPASDARRSAPGTLSVPLCAPVMEYEIFVARRARRQLSPAAAALRAVLLQFGRPLPVHAVP